MDFDFITVVRPSKELEQFKAVCNQLLSRNLCCADYRTGRAKGG